jgi:hypothetical protein
MAERRKFRDKDMKWFDDLVCTVSYALWKTEMLSTSTMYNAKPLPCFGGVQID